MLGNMKRAINVYWDTVSDCERKNFVNSIIKVPRCALQCGNTYDLKLYECTLVPHSYLI